MSYLKEHIGILLSEMQVQIIADHESVRAFCRAHNIDRHNLSKVLSGKQPISVGLFMRLSIALGKMPPDVVSEAQLSTLMSLEEYLQLPYQALLLTILKFTTA